MMGHGKNEMYFFEQVNGTCIKYFSPSEYLVADVITVHLMRPTTELMNGLVR
jgi:hypothetical protein